MITTRSLKILALTAGAALSLGTTIPTGASAHFSLPPSAGRIPPGCCHAIGGPSPGGPGRINGLPVPGPNNGRGEGNGRPRFGGGWPWGHGRTGYWGGFHGYGYGYPASYSSGPACQPGFFLNYWGHCRPLPY